MAKIAGPATVAIQRPNRGQVQEKVINVEHVKHDVQNDTDHDVQVPDDAEVYVCLPMLPGADNEPMQEPAC